MQTFHKNNDSRIKPLSNKEQCKDERKRKGKESTIYTNNFSFLEGRDRLMSYW